MPVSWLELWHGCFWAWAGSNHIGNFLFSVISGFSVFGRMEIVDMAIWKFWIFRQNLKFWNLRSISSSKGHIWTSMSIISGRHIIYGPHGPYISAGKSIYGPYGPYISGGSLYMDHADHIFWYEVQPQTHIPKPNPKPISRRPNPKTLSQTQSQTYIPNPIPNLYPKNQSQTHIPKPNPKPISQTQSQT